MQPNAPFPEWWNEGDVARVTDIRARVVAARSALAAAQAAEAEALADAARLAHEQATRCAARAQEREMQVRSLAAELACAMRVSDRTVQRRMSSALTLVDDFPLTFEALRAGRASQSHVHIVLEAAGSLGGDARARFDRLAATRAESHAPGRFRALLERAAEQLQPRTLQERHDEARKTRRVVVVPLADGMAELIATLPAILAHGIHDRLTQQAACVRDARASASAGPATTRDERTTDELRADILADMLLTACPGADPTATGDGPGALGAIHAIVQVTVPALALAGCTAEPALLAGRAPVDPDTARRLAGGATGWDRVLSDPIGGGVLAVDRYRPGPGLTRFLRARDEHCRFPGCRVPAARCDIDHTQDAARGGPTEAGNLAHLCRRHHTLKHATPWSVQQRDDGVLEWTSPAGQQYADHPPGRAPAGVSFVEVGDPPPF